VVNEVRETMRRRTRDQWLTLFADADVCLTPVNDLDAALSDPHARARGVVVLDGRDAYIAPPDAAVRPAPALGADTEAVLEEAGIDRAARERLRRDRIV